MVPVLTVRREKYSDLDELTEAKKVTKKVMFAWCTSSKTANAANLLQTCRQVTMHNTLLLQPAMCFPTSPSENVYLENVYLLCSFQDISVNEFTISHFAIDISGK